ncbi:MAG: GAF domain-containing sensor histidine kinase [Myxococcales bacterium]|nr:GAF domain-containing sensor histidine kinase [Myxococcales bacterium]
MTDERMSAFEKARLTIARAGVSSEAELDEAVAKVTRIASETLDVERSSLWMLDEDDVLRCVHLHVRGRGQVPCDVALRMADYPRYAEAGRTRRVIATEDARHDPTTEAFCHAYLEPNGIHSMLDAPVFQSGKIVGMLCQEHCGRGPRAWATRDVDFAGSMADLLSVAFEQAARTEAERARAAAEHRLAAQERMAALGRLAAGVAHDLANIVQLATLQVAVLAREPLGEVGRGAVALLDDAMAQEQRLLRQLLVFARQGSVRRSPVDVAGVVASMRPLLDAIAAGGKLHVDTGQGGLVCLLDRGQLEQVLTNLVRNAFEASPGGEVRVAVRGEIGRVAIEVADDGPGVPSELRERVFEPFFTTKEKGSGLGLAVVRTIAEANGGTLALTGAREGERPGARFRLTFPIASNDDAAEASS